MKKSYCLFALVLVFMLLVCFACSKTPEGQDTEPESVETSETESDTVADSEETEQTAEQTEPEDTTPVWSADVKVD